MDQNPVGYESQTLPEVPLDVPLTGNLSEAEQERIWITQTLAGNTNAFAHLVERYKNPVYNLAYRMLGRAADAEDAAQEAFVRAYTQLATYEPTRKFSTWLLSIAAHYCIDQLRRKSATSLDAIEGYDAPANADEEPEEIALDNEQRELVRRLLDTLPANYRSVVILRYFNDMSYAEIALATNLSESAVKTRLHRAREMLAQRARSIPELAMLESQRPDESGGHEARATVKRNESPRRARQSLNGFAWSLPRLQPGW